MYMDFLIAAEAMTSILCCKKGNVNLSKKEKNETGIGIAQKSNHKIDDVKKKKSEDENITKIDKRNDDNLKNYKDDDNNGGDSEDPLDDSDETNENNDETNENESEFSIISQKGINDYFNETQLAEQFYSNSVLDYVKLFYGDEKRNSAYESEKEYILRGSVFEMKSEMITFEEANDIMREAQYAAVLGDRTGINYDDLRKLDMWIKFNPALFKMIESSHSLTNDSNYSPPR